MGRIQDLRMDRAKREFREEMFPTDKSRSFFVDYAGNAIGFRIERYNGPVLSYSAGTGRYEPFEVLPEDGAVNMVPYGYQGEKIVDLLSQDPVENIQKYTCFYAAYFCGDFGRVITEQEYRDLEASGALDEGDTMEYEPIFDGKIYPTLADSAAAQMEAFGYHFADDRRKTPSRAEQSVTPRGNEIMPSITEIIRGAQERRDQQASQGAGSGGRGGRGDR